MMGTMTKLLENQWHLSAVHRGAMVSVVFVGFSLGNLAAGFVGDQCGRRRAIIIGYALIGTFGFLSSTSWNPGVMVVFRFFIGIGCGIGFPSAFSLITEISPTNSRGWFTSLIVGFMPIGEFFAAVLVWAIDHDLRQSEDLCDVTFPDLFHPQNCTWRSMAALAAVPAFCFAAIAVAVLPESPLWLQSKGKSDELSSLMERMREENGVPETNHCSATTPSEITAGCEDYSWGAVLAEIWSPSYYSTTACLCWCHFTKDFTFFGLGYVLPQYFHSLKTIDLGEALIMMALLGLPGVATALILTKSPHGHIQSMKVCAVVCSISALGMLNRHKDVLGAPCAICCKSAAMAFFICTNIYTSEFYPTKIRTSAFGFCTAFGRMGSISAPVGFEISFRIAGNFDLYVFTIITLMLGVLAFSACALSVETKWRKLDSPTICFHEETPMTYGSTSSLLCPPSPPAAAAVMKNVNHNVA